MQLSYLHVSNFRGLAEVEFSFVSPDGGGPRPITLILGDNGSGKTTLLQAVALVIGLATRRFAEPSDLKWPGFLPERLATLGTTRIEVHVVFSAEELARTQELYALWSRRARPELVQAIPPPDNLARVTLTYEDGVLSCKEGRPALGQFLGRQGLSGPEILRDQAQVPGDGPVFVCTPRAPRKAIRHRRNVLGRAGGVPDPL